MANTPYPPVGGGIYFQVITFGASNTASRLAGRRHLPERRSTVTADASLSSDHKWLRDPAGRVRGERFEASAESAVGGVAKKYLVVLPIWEVRYRTQDSREIASDGRRWVGSCLSETASMAASAQGDRESQRARDHSASFR
jgi:hypothetical protein